MSFQNFDQMAPPREGAPQNSIPLTDNNQNIFRVIEALLRQEHQSKHYQGELESRINSNSAEFQRSHAHSLQLQRVICGLQHQKSQLQTSLVYMTEACRAMTRDVKLEKAKVQELESRLTEAYPSIDSLLEYLAFRELNGENLSDGVNSHLLLENHRQRELIISLESNLQKREEATRELKSRLEETVHELRLVSHGQHEPGRLSPDEMAGGPSEESSIEIITENSPAFIG